MNIDYDREGTECVSCSSHRNRRDKKNREELKREAEAEVVVAVVGRVVVAIGDATVPRVVVPATATVHAVRPRIMETLLVVLIFSDEKHSYLHEV